MDTVIKFIILGIAIGGVYALVTHGMTLIYRGSGLVNFAQGGFVVAGAYLFYFFRVTLGLGSIFAVILALLASAAIGAAFQLLVLRSMREASPVTRVVATLALVLVIQSTVGLIWASTVLTIPPLLPETTVHLFSGVTIGVDRLIILGIAAVLTVVLWAIYKFTQFGRVTSAVSENEIGAASLGFSPNLIAVINWAAGGALGGLAGILIAPITLLQASSLSLLVVPALAAGMVCNFSSFPIAFFASITVGAMQSLAGKYIHAAGWANSIPFFIVIALLVFRGSGLPLRSYIQERLPRIGTAQIRYWLLVPVVAFCVWFLLSEVNAEWAFAVSVTLSSAIILLSVVVLTGYAGQLSLAQYVIAGAGALAAARVMADLHTAYLVGLLAAIVCGIVIGVAVGLPALRTRGVSLAIATFGLALVLHDVVLSNRTLSGGANGVIFGEPSIFGWKIDSLTHSENYAVVTLIALVLCCIVVSNLRRGPVGRRLIAIRSSERAAASLGVSVYASKLYAFVIASCLASLGGAILGLANFAVVTSPFEVFASINVTAVAVVGGVGYIGGAIISSLLLQGGITSLALRSIQSLDSWLPLITGAYLLLVLRSGGTGLYEMNRAIVVGGYGMARKVAFRSPAGGAPEGGRAPVPKFDVRPRAVAPAASPAASPDAEASQNGTATAILEVSGLTVRFGGVTAVNDVSLNLHPGKVHGLIGPNGAGKTTFIDAVTGFVKPAAGTISLRGESVNRWSAPRRARKGLARSFQSVEIFSDLTIAENLAVGSDDFRTRHYITGLFHTPRMQLSESAVAAGEAFEISDRLGEMPDTLPFGERRLVAIARAVASDPTVLLLDEPAAGLDSSEAAELGEVIRDLARRSGIAILLVEHNLDLVLSVSDWVSVLDTGKQIYSGPSTEVMKDKGVVAAYVGVEDPVPELGELSTEKGGER
jgi:ABC-type branched-subunit amino acid transport system ATPase component/branched-subunit amino acid ABC-type transport system permease component